MRKMCFNAFDNGITHYDLANNYGPPEGTAEINFGRILKEDLAVYRDELIISTKSGDWMWPGPYGEWGSGSSCCPAADSRIPTDPRFLKESTLTPERLEQIRQLNDWLPSVVRPWPRWH